MSETKQASDLIHDLSIQHDISKKDSGKALRYLLSLIVSQVIQGIKCRIVGFGHFSIHRRKEKTVTAPNQSESSTVPKRIVLFLTFSDTVTKLLNKKESS